MLRTRPLISNTQPERHGKSTTLVVILHGVGRGLEDWCDAVREYLPDADLLLPSYPAHLLSNVAPRRVADQLAQYIQEADTNRSRQPKGGTYQHIILIGYSSGGLIIRKTYLIAAGYGEDEALMRHPDPLPWASKVQRILLMSSINRGISTTKAARTSWLTHVIHRIGWALIPITGHGKFLTQLRQGSPFVANLRVQWIRLGQDSKDRLVPTIQLLGDIDEIVSEEDNIDVLTDRNFRYFKLRDTGHASIRDFKAPIVGAHRKEKFRQALVTPIDQLSGDLVINEHEVGQPKDDVVFVMHGIRDNGIWAIEVGDALKTVAQKIKRSVEPIKAGYGYFPMLRFLFLGARQANVRWFMDRYTEAIARYPNAKISFIGHSNGTYLLAAALKRYKSCKVHHVAFAGSVVPKAYPWDTLVQQGRVKAIRNDVASADWIVGIFPGLFELLHLSDIGTAGHNGFQDDAPKDSSFDKYFKGSHGAALNPSNYLSIADFILTGENHEPQGGLLITQRNGLVALISKQCWFVWLLIGAALGGLGYLFCWILSVVTISPILSIPLYIGLVPLLLYTL
ncbi:MAG: alpha/beta hydrolase [Cyanobacteria bacterium J06555_13]